MVILKTMDFKNLLLLGGFKRGLIPRNLISPAGFQATTALPQQRRVSA
jgi:hypothetical protein